MARKKRNTKIDIKNNIFAVWTALENEGCGLYETAQNDPKWFYDTFIKKMTPSNVEVEHSGQVGIASIIEEIEREATDVLVNDDHADDSLIFGTADDNGDND